MTATEAGPRLPWRAAKVLDIVDETSRARSLVLGVDGWPGHKAGQHVDLRLTAEDGYQAQRSYSIASPPERAEIVLTVERIDDGELSPFLTEEVRAGDTLELRGPIGGYFTWTGDELGPLQLLAGGSGIVPLMAMLRHRARIGRARAARLLYSTRGLADTIYRDELGTLAAGDDGLRVAHTLTRAAPPGWTGLTGRVDRRMLEEHAFAPAAAPVVYVCGPTPFVETVATLLVELGHPPGRIKTERFGPTGGSS